MGEILHTQANWAALIIVAQLTRTQLPCGLKLDYTTIHPCKFFLEFVQCTHGFKICGILCYFAFLMRGWDLGQDGKLWNGRNGRSGNL